MAIEAKRGCGYRKVGGLYLVGSGLGHDCCKLPIPLGVCPTCGGGVKQTRGWTWIDPRPWLRESCQHKSLLCPAAAPEILGPRVGLLWIGRQFYPTPGAFLHEANTQGISRRISGVPRGFEVGQHWVFLAHPEACVLTLGGPDQESKKGPGIFSIFKPSAIEKIITKSQSEDPEVMADLDHRGISAVVVPDDDRDHQGTVYDEAEDPELPLESHVVTAIQEKEAEDHHAT